jgi:hypothetical protein
MNIINYGIVSVSSTKESPKNVNIRLRYRLGKRIQSPFAAFDLRVACLLPPRLLVPLHFIFPKYSDWESTGIKKRFRDLVKESVRDLEASTAKRMSVHMTHKVEAHRIFRILLTDSVQQMIRLHRMMDAQFQHYRQILGVGCDESN